MPPPEPFEFLDVALPPDGNLRLILEDVIRYAGHVGYAVEPAHRGHRYAERACRLIVPLAKRHGMTEL